MKEFFKKLWLKIKAKLAGYLVETPAKDVAIVQVPPVDKHPEPPVPVEKPNQNVTIGPPGNEISISKVTDNFLQSGAGYGKVPEVSTPGTAVQYTGFAITQKFHPYVNTLNLGQVYTYDIPTAVNEEVEIFILEVSGTPDQASVIVRVTDNRGNVIVADTPFIRNGSVSFVSNGGLYQMLLVQSADGPRGVQRN